MKKVFFLIIFFSLFLIPVFQVSAQSLSSTEQTQIVFDTTGFPQWAKDLRRWEIVAFGTFPFSLFFVTFATDMVRWYNTNGMDFSAYGRRYAPWPFRSAGAVDRSSQDLRRSIFMAAGLSMTTAFIDLFVVNRNRSNERRRLESMPPGSTVIIERTPPENDDPGVEDGIED